jgi:hypothetical protein
MKARGLIVFFLCVVLQLSSQNRFRINGIGTDAAFIPEKYNSKSFEGQFTARSSETKWARDVMATLSLFYNDRINLLAAFGYQWHTINPQDPLFSDKTQTSVLYKLSIGAEYKVYAQNKHRFYIQGLFGQEGMNKDRSRFRVDEASGPGIVRKELFFYAYGSYRLSAEARCFYSYNLLKHTRVFAGTSLNIGLFRSASKAYYTGPVYEDPFFPPSNTVYTLNRSRRVLERYYALHVGVRTDIFIKKK